MATGKQSTQDALETLARQRDAGAISDAQFDAEVARLLNLDRVPQFVGRQGFPQTTPTASAPARRPTRAATIVAWALVALLLLGLGGAALDDQANRQKLQAASKNQAELSTQVSSLQSQNQSLQSQIASVAARNQDLQQRADKPSLTLWEVRGASLPAGRYYSVAIPEGFSVELNLSSASSPMDLRFFRAGEFANWWNNGAPVGGGEGWFGRTTLQSRYPRATGCPDRIFVINGASDSTFSLSLKATYEGFSGSTC